MGTLALAEGSVCRYQPSQANSSIAQVNVHAGV